MTIVFDPDAFRVAFPTFANKQCFPDTTLQANFDTGCLFVSPDGACYSSGWTTAQLTQALFYMTAHVARIDQAIRDDEPLEIVRSGMVSKVSVQVVTPPGSDRDSFDYWLGLTPYGRALLALLAAVTAGGYYFGGSPERSAFRAVGGRFGGGWC